MTPQTIFAETTADIARPLAQRITSRLFGRPPSRTYQAHLVAEAVVAGYGSPTLGIEVDDGRATVIVTADPDAPRESELHVMRLQLRERGAAGRFHKLPGLVVIQASTLHAMSELPTETVRAPYEAPSLRRLTTEEEIAEAAMAFGDAATPHTGGLVARITSQESVRVGGLTVDTAGNAKFEQRIEVNGAHMRVISETGLSDISVRDATPEERGAVEAGQGRQTVMEFARSPDWTVPHWTKGKPPFECVSDLDAELTRLVVVEETLRNEAARLHRAAISTNVAKRKAAYAVRSRETLLRAEAVMRARRTVAADDRRRKAAAMVGRGMISRNDARAVASPNAARD